MAEQKAKKSTSGKNKTSKKSQQIDISPFVTNPDGDIYAITNLPEEFVAVLFAWVSRSPESFKTLLRRSLEEGHIDAEAYKNLPDLKHLSDRAKKFHKKWTVNYGHSSVAEHAIAHVGIEKISRLASAELELSNEFYSITEYSQRYQRPKRGDWYNPLSKDTQDYARYEEFMHQAYDTFEKLIDGLFNHLKQKLSTSKRKSKKELSRIEKQAFEDARYALPLSMYTQLGMTANGRAWRDGISRLLSSSYDEVKKTANGIKQEIQKVLPTLLLHAEESEYERKRHMRMKRHFDPHVRVSFDDKNNVKLINYTSEQNAIMTLITQLMVELQSVPHEEALARARLMPLDKKHTIARELLWEMGPFDVPPEAFKQIHYQFELIVSEANWHQLLRHNRKTHFVYSRPSPHNGLTIPPTVKEAGLEDELIELSEASYQLYDSLSEDVRDYVVLNAHRRQVIADFNLWEAYHLINLRTSQEAQWDIRKTFEEVYHQIKMVHPNLIYAAKRRK